MDPQGHRHRELIEWIIIFSHLPCCAFYFIFTYPALPLWSSISYNSKFRCAEIFCNRWNLGGRLAGSPAKFQADVAPHTWFILIKHAARSMNNTKRICKVICDKFLKVIACKDSSRSCTVRRGDYGFPHHPRLILATYPPDRSAKVSGVP